MKQNEQPSSIVREQLALDIIYGVFLCLLEHEVDFGHIR